jgi:hypothetical protein
VVGKEPKEGQKMGGEKEDLEVEATKVWFCTEGGWM